MFWGIGNEQRIDDAATNTLLDQLASAGRHRGSRTASPTYASCCVSDTGAVDRARRRRRLQQVLRLVRRLVQRLRRLGRQPARREPDPADRAVSEYGAGASITQHALNPPTPDHRRPYHPEEYQALLHEASLEAARRRARTSGASSSGTCSTSPPTAATRAARPGINDKGLVTYDRKTKKDAFFWYKANWATTPFVYITSRRWTPRTDRRHRAEGLLERGHGRPPP